MIKTKQNKTGDCLLTVRRPASDVGELNIKSNYSVRFKQYFNQSSLFFVLVHFKPAVVHMESKNMKNNTEVMLNIYIAVVIMIG